MPSLSTTTAPPYVQPRVFSIDEGLWLTALANLLTPYRAPAFAAPQSVAPSDDVVRAGIHQIATAGLRQLLFHGHGARPHTVLRQGQRRRGTIFDPAMNAEFRLRYSAATRDAWIGLAKEITTLRSGDTGTRRAKRVARETIVVDKTLPGDWLFFWTIASGLCAEDMLAQDATPLRRRIWTASPLAALAECRRTELEHLRRLLAPSSVRLIELFGPPLRRGWAREFDAFAGATGDVEAMVARGEEVTEVLDSWISVLESAERMDLVQPVLLAIVDFAERLSASSLDVRRQLTNRFHLRTMAERELALRPYRRLFEIGTRLLERRDAFSRIGYGEERYDEAQLYLHAIDTISASSHETLRLVASDVRGALG